MSRLAKYLQQTLKNRFLSAQKPEEYVKKGQERSSFLGKQLANAYPKEGKTIDTYFEKKHNWIADVSILTVFIMTSRC